MQACVNRYRQSSLASADSDITYAAAYCKRHNFRGLKFSRIGPTLEI
ncbi:MAG: hypothetical protein PV344_08280 [Anaplasma sp.]|nr:hypothetical protein [Anaplasma sp.]